MRNKVVVAFRKLNGVVAKPYDKLQQLAQEEGIRLVPRVLLFVCVELVEHLAEFALIEEEGGFAVKLFQNVRRHNPFGKFKYVSFVGHA